MRKDPGSIQTVALSITCNFVTVARQAAARERRPIHSAGGPQAASRNPGRISGRKSSSTSILSRLQLNYIGISLIWTQKLFHHFFRVPRGVTRWGDGGHSSPWRPPWPRGRGEQFMKLRHGADPAGEPFGVFESKFFFIGAEDTLDLQVLLKPVTDFASIAVWAFRGREQCFR